MRKKTQVEMVMEHLKKHGSITYREAFDLFRVGNLASTISKIRRLGYEITMVKEREEDQRRSYARYYMVSTEPEKPKRKSKPPKKEKVVRKDRTPKALKCEHKDSRMWKRG